MVPDDILDRLRSTGVVAGFSVEKATDAVPICKALLAGGIDVIELTLRTPAALEGLKLICKQVPEMLIGVGTILTAETAVEVKNTGAHFGVSPGMNPNVIRAAKDCQLPFAPGIATPSDLEAAIELGCRLVKFFPAEPMGGVKYLKSMATPYKHLGIQYFPLGGVNADNMLEYLNEPNVPAVGGSWIVQQEMVGREDWAGITRHAASVVKALELRI